MAPEDPVAPEESVALEEMFLIYNDQIMFTFNCNNVMVVSA